MAFFIGLQKDIENRIKPLIPKQLEDAAEVAAAAITTIGLSTIVLSAVYKMESWSTKNVKLLSINGFEFVKSLKTGGMLGVASIIDSLFGLIIRQAFKRVIPEKWADAIGVHRTPYIPQWNSHQDLALSFKPVKTQVEIIQIPNWMRIAQRAAALAITYFAFSALLGPQPLLLACVAMDLTWFVFNGLKAGMNSSCEPQGALYMLGQALTCAAPEIYMICGGIAITSYIVYLAAKKQFMNDPYYLVKNGVKTDEKVSFTLADAKHYAIGIRKIEGKANFSFEGESITGEKNTTIENLKKRLKADQDIYQEIEAMSFSKTSNPKISLSTENNEFTAVATIASFLNDLCSERTDQKTLTEKLQKEKAELEKNCKTLEKNQTALRNKINPKSTLDAIRQAGKDLQKSIAEGISTRARLECTKQLLDALEKKSYDDICQELQLQAQEHAEVYRIHNKYMDFKKAHPIISSPTAIKTFYKHLLSLSIATYKLRIKQKTAPPPVNKDTIYWEALYKSRKVILRQDQLYAIPVSTRLEEYNRQRQTRKLSVIKDFFGAATNTFLQQVGGLNPTALISGGGLFWQIGAAAAIGGMELLKLVPENSSILNSLGPFKGAFGSSDDEKQDPTGNENLQDKLQPREHALLSSQVNHCVNIIDECQRWYDSQNLVLPGDFPTQNADPLYQDAKQQKFTEFYDTKLKKNRPNIGVVSRALIDELGIQGKTDEEKYHKLQKVIHYARGESFKERENRLKAKQAALTNAKLSKEDIEKKFAAPKGSWKSELRGMHYQMDLITPLPSKRKANPLTDTEIQAIYENLAKMNLKPFEVEHVTKSPHLNLLRAMSKLRKDKKAASG